MNVDGKAGGRTKDAYWPPFSEAWPKAEGEEAVGAAVGAVPAGLGFLRAGGTKAGREASGAFRLVCKAGWMVGTRLGAEGVEGPVVGVWVEGPS